MRSQESLDLPRASTIAPRAAQEADSRVAGAVCVAEGRDQMGKPTAIVVGITAIVVGVGAEQGIGGAACRWVRLRRISRLCRRTHGGEDREGCRREREGGRKRGSRHDRCDERIRSFSARNPMRRF